MKPSEQRIALSRFSGYWAGETRKGLWVLHKPDGNLGDVWASSEEAAWIKNTPDYLGDLNAMQQICRTLTPKQRTVLAHRLSCMLADGAKTEDFATVYATAAQRAEALLRTLNLWTS